MAILRWSGWLAGGLTACVVVAGTNDLTELSLEQVLNLEITSVSKRPEPWFNAPAAVYVLTGDDLRRSGATTIQDALRTVPGMQVASVESHAWSVTARGFSSELPNKLLVLIDGRSIYSPLFAGVWWGQHNPLLEDIERVEIVRGPGTTLWGANAVNGVINIITKNAADSQGALLSAGGGTEELALGAGRYGGKLGADAFYRVYARYWNRDDSAVAGTDDDAADHAWGAQVGYRIDWKPTAANLLTMQGDGFVYRGDDLFAPPLLVSPFSDPHHLKRRNIGGNLLGRWTHFNANGSDFKVQAGYDGVYETLNLDERARDIVHQFRLEFDQRFRWGDRQEIVWGLDYHLVDSDLRLVNDTKLSFSQSVLPKHRLRHLYSAFVQDEIALVPEQLHFILGSKFEHNDFTGWEIQPTARLLWRPQPRHTAWGAVSRAARTPSLFDSDYRFNLAVVPGMPDPSTDPPTLISISRFGEKRMSEEEIAYELGYRVRPTDSLWFDLAAFYNVYDRLVSFEPGAPFVEDTPLPIHLVQPLVIKHKLAGETYGVELAGNWSVTDWWRVRASYSFLQIQLHRQGSLDTPTERGVEGRSPHHQCSLQSAMDLGRHWELDGTLRYVDSLPDFNVPGYVALDVRLAWKPSRHWEVAIVGRNLLRDQHAETRTTIIPVEQTAVQRGVYGKVTWRY